MGCTPIDTPLMPKMTKKYYVTSVTNTLIRASPPTTITLNKYYSIHRITSNDIANLPQARR